MRLIDLCLISQLLSSDLTSIGIALGGGGPPFIACWTISAFSLSDKYGGTGMSFTMNLDFKKIPSLLSP